MRLYGYCEEDVRFKHEQVFLPIKKGSKSRRDALLKGSMAGVSHLDVWPTGRDRSLKIPPGRLIPPTPNKAIPPSASSADAHVHEECEHSASKCEGEGESFDVGCVVCIGRPEEEDSLSIQLGALMEEKGL